MKTTQEKVLNAYATLNKMSQNPMNSFTAFKLFKLKKALQDTVDFQVEQERKIVDEFGGEINEVGQFKIDPEKRKEFNEKLKELNGMECEIDRDKTVILMAELKDVSLAEMEALEDFVEWKEK